MINTEGHNVNPQFNEVYNHIMRFKLNSLLQESYFTSKASFNKLELERANYPIEDIAKQHFTKQMADKIIQVKGKIDFTPNTITNQIELSCELLVFNPKQFKLIVEHTIRELSQETLNSIRNNPNQ